MCTLLTPVLYCITTVLIEVYLQCFTESVSLRDIGKPTSRAEIGSPCSLCPKAVKGDHLESALKQTKTMRLIKRIITLDRNKKTYFYN